MGANETSIFTWEVSNGCAGESSNRCYVWLLMRWFLPSFTNLEVCIEKMRDIGLRYHSSLGRRSSPFAGGGSPGMPPAPGTLSPLLGSGRGGFPLGAKPGLSSGIPPGAGG